MEQTFLKKESTKNYKIFGEKEFFSNNNGLYCLNEELEIFKNNEAFLTHFKDVIAHKTRKFYKEGLEKRNESI